MKGKILGFAVALLSLSVIGVTQLPANAAVDNGRDCDRFAIIWCGAKTPAELRAEYDSNGTSNANGSTKSQSDIKKVFSGMGVSRSQLNGTFKDGVVYQDGRVVVDGKTVATGAVMAARGLGGSTISGTSAQKVSVSKMGSAQTAMVKFDSNGRFLFAVMKPCGNVVKATPTKPKPQPKPSAACKAVHVTRLSNSQYRFDAAATTANGAKVKSYVYTVSRDGKVVYTKTTTSKQLAYTSTTPGSYSVRLSVNTTVGTKTNNTDCVKTFTIPKPPVKKISVCDLETKKFITIKESEFDSSKHSKNPEDCKEKPPVEVCNPETGETEFVPKEDEDKYLPVDSEACKDIEVCVLETKTYPVTIKQAEFDSDKHSTNPADCEETPVTPPTPEAPQELPETGPADVALSVLSLGAVISGAGYYVASRRS